MGIELVEGQDLFVRDEAVFMRTTQGPQRVDVIYRRIDDDFLDPLVFRPDSMLGVPGLLDGLSRRPRHHRQCHRHRRRRRQVDLPLRAGDDPFLPGRGAASSATCPPGCCASRKTATTCSRTCPSWSSRRFTARAATACSSAGRNHAPRSRIFAQQIIATPERYIAQPTLALSTCPTFVAAGLAPRHIDLRPFVLSGTDVTIVPGGLTRVALREGSLVVNSSQGGGTKDTWVLES